MHYLIKKAFLGLYPGKELDRDVKLKYSKAFKGFNANVRYNAAYMEFRLSHPWKEVSDEIQIGLIQTLFNKVNQTSVKSVNIDLYEIFLKKVPALSPKTRTEPMLEDSFLRMNQRYFDGLLMQPNLEFGGINFHTLGTYSYTDDTIRISSVLRKDLHLLDYVMYHEMLHKKFQYRKTAKKTIHHSREFREWEKRFDDPDIEKKLNRFLRLQKISAVF